MVSPTSKDCGSDAVPLGVTTPATVITPPVTVAVGVTVTLVVADVDAAFATLSARGVVFDGAPVARGGHRSAFFRDPVGYRLEIQSFDDPRWPPPAA